MKIIGSGLVLFSGVMLGFYKALRYMEIQENLHMMISVMELLIGQIKTERATLKEAVCRISVRQSGEIGRVLQSTARSIQKNDGKELYMIWHEEMETLSLVLPETVREVWIHMFDSPFDFAYKLSASIIPSSISDNIILTSFRSSDSISVLFRLA